jgi:galactokinase
MDAGVSSTIPPGSGLSSSAALEVGLALALFDVSRIEVPAVDLALACQRAEHIATGVPCGVMDQLASLGGRSGHALLLDCRSLTYELVRLPDELGLIVIHSRLARTLSATAYADRRAKL